MFSSHRIRAGILVVVLDTTSRVPLLSKLPVGRAMRSFLVFGTFCSSMKLQMNILSPSLGSKSKLSKNQTAQNSVRFRQEWYL
jgi:hypothetical protein